MSTQSSFVTPSMHPGLGRFSLYEPLRLIDAPVKESVDRPPTMTTARWIPDSNPVPGPIHPPELDPVVMSKPPSAGPDPSGPASPAAPATSFLEIQGPDIVIGGSYRVSKTAAMITGGGLLGALLLKTLLH